MSSSKGAVPQLPLALRYPPDQRLETFVGAPEGLVAQLQAAASAPTRDALFIAGPSGSGKTHLLLGACAAADAHGRRAGYLPLASAAGRMREAIEALEGFDLIALDGVDAIAGTREDEIALFDAHNRARAAGRTLLYASRLQPDELPLTLPDLRSRLSQCTRVVLDVLDDAGRRAMLQQRALRRGWELEDAAADWLLRRVGRDLAGLAVLLDRLDRASLAAKRKVTVPFLRQVLGQAV